MAVGGNVILGKRVLGCVVMTEVVGVFVGELLGCREGIKDGEAVSAEHRNDTMPLKRALLS